MSVSKKHDLVDLVVSAKTVEDSQKYYSKWAENYDEDLATLKRKSPETAVKILLGLFNGRKSKAVRILDLAAGTGAVAEELIKNGFEGQIDAIDGNRELLKQAKNKKIYESLTEQILLPDSDINADDNAYDFILCIGALFPNHLPYQIVTKMARHLKTNGYMIFSVWNSEKIRSYREKLENELQKLVEENALKLECAEEHSQFVNLDERSSDTQSSTVFCYKKIKDKN